MSGCDTIPRKNTINRNAVNIHIGFPVINSKWCISNAMKYLSLNDFLTTDYFKLNT